jgi:hypothetical protein
MHAVERFTPAVRQTTKVATAGAIEPSQRNSRRHIRFRQTMLFVKI